MARAGVGSTVDVLRLFSSYSSETNYTVWESLCSNLASLNRLLSYTHYHHTFRTFAQRLFDQSVVRLGWDAKDTDSEWGRGRGISNVHVHVHA